MMNGAVVGYLNYYSSLAASRSAAPDHVRVGRIARQYPSTSAGLLMEARSHGDGE